MTRFCPCIAPPSENKAPMVAPFAERRRRLARALLSGIQPLDRPARAGAGVQHAIVQPIGTAVPELDPLGNQAIAAPERRAMDLAVEKPRFDLAVLRFEHFA